MAAASAGVSAAADARPMSGTALRLRRSLRGVRSYAGAAVRVGRLLRARHLDLAKPVGHHGWHRGVPRRPRHARRSRTGGAAAPGRSRRRPNHPRCAIEPGRRLRPRGPGRATPNTRRRLAVRTGDLCCRWSGADQVAVAEDGTLEARIQVDADTPYHDLVLQISRHEAAEQVDPDQAWARTARAWRSLVPTFPASAAPRDSRHAYAVLRGLSAPGGGMVAPATLGLPGYPGWRRAAASPRMRRAGTGPSPISSSDAGPASMAAT